MHAIDRSTIVPPAIGGLGRQLPIYLDTETTGLDPQFDSIVEIGLVDHDGAIVFSSLVKPRDMCIPPAATAIHGITDDDVRDAPHLADIIGSVMQLIAGRELVIYNAAFDAPFLGLNAVDATCAGHLAMRAMGLQRWPKLQVAASWAGHDWGTSHAHRAVSDALAARTVHLRARQVLEERAAARDVTRPTPSFIRTREDCQ